MISLLNNPYLIVLVGLKHAGKSTVARALNHAFGYNVKSLDQGIVERSGFANVAEAYRMLGRRRFRHIEYTLLRDWLSTHTTNRTHHKEEHGYSACHMCVLDCGGGVISYAPTRRLLRAFSVMSHRLIHSDMSTALVYLRADSDTLMMRFTKTPAFLNSHTTRAQNQWRRIATRRARQYAAIHPITVDADTFQSDTLNMRAMAKRILEHINIARADKAVYPSLKNKSRRAPNVLCA